MADATLGDASWIEEVLIPYLRGQTQPGGSLYSAEEDRPLVSPPTEGGALGRNYPDMLRGPLGYGHAPIDDEEPTRLPARVPSGGPPAELPAPPRGIAPSLPVGGGGGGGPLSPGAAAASFDMGPFLAPIVGIATQRDRSRYTDEQLAEGLAAWRAKQSPKGDSASGPESNEPSGHDTMPDNGVYMPIPSPPSNYDMQGASPLATSDGASPFDPSRAPQPSAFDAEIKDTLRKRDEAVGRAEQSMGREQDVFARRESEMEPRRQRYSAMADQAMLERHEAHEKLKDKRIEEGAPPQRNDTKADSDWLSAATMIGALAGALTRRHVTNGLAAFTGAMQGYQEGSQQKFENNMKTWEAERKKAIDTHQQAQDEYRNILENRKLDMDGMSIELQMAAQKYQDQAMATAAQTKNSLTIAQLYDQSAKYLEQSKTAHDRLSQQWELSQERLTQQKALAQMRALGADPSKLQDKVEGIAEGREPAVPGMRGSALMDLAEKYSKDVLGKPYDATLYPRRKRAQEAFATGIEGRQVRSLNVAIAHLDTVEELSRALGNSDFPTLNRLANTVSTQLGYSMPTSFNAAKQIVTAEIIKAVVANGGGVQERQEAAKQLDSSSSWDQLIGVIGTYKSLLGGQMKGLQKQYERNTGLYDFQTMLEPETVKALTSAGVAPAPLSTPPGYRKTGDDKGVLSQAGDLLAHQFWESPFPSMGDIRSNLAGSTLESERAEGRIPGAPEFREFLRQLPGWGVEQVK